MSGVLPLEEAMALSPTRRLAYCVIAGRIRGDCGVWDWFNREWVKPKS